MTQQNFFLLLNLPVDPPEESLKIIQAAIKKKQTEWSRDRNHPTKGIQAKLFIDLIPEIRKVMLDPELRKKEARKAKKQLSLADDLKASVIDRHLSIYFTKGSVTDDEIKKLQKLHGVEVDTILRRVIQIEKRAGRNTRASIDPTLAKKSAPPEEKLLEIDKSLGIQMRKGYITEADVSKLAEAYSISQSEIVNRTNYPIQEKKDQAGAVPKTLDQSIEKVINNDLALLGKSSLYDFLDLPVSASLDSLKTRAEQLRAKAIATSHKNAIVTASAELAGHCATIFKTAKNRTAYDVSRALADLEAFHTDIDVAEMDGMIHAKYFEALIQNATELGMGYDEAREYIENYCLNMNWVVKSKQNQKRLVTLAAAVVLSLVILIGGSVTLFKLLKHNRLENEYQDVLAKVKIEKQLEKKKALVSQYLATHDQDEFVGKARKKLHNIQVKIKKRNAIDQRDYKTALKNAAGPHSTKEYEKTEKIYQKYLKKHPEGRHVDEFKQKIAAIPDLIDDRDFQNLGAIPRRDYQKRIEAYTAYLTNHPEGKYRNQTDKMISDMNEDYYRYMNKKINAFEKEKNWEACILLCDYYLEVYKQSDRAVDIKGERYFFQKQLENSRLLERLVQMAARMGRNYVKAKQVYMDYLNANPDSPIKYEVKREIAKLKKQRSKYRY